METVYITAARANALGIQTPGRHPSDSVRLMKSTLNRLIMQQGSSTGRMASEAPSYQSMPRDVHDSVYANPAPVPCPPRWPPGATYIPSVEAATAGLAIAKAAEKAVAKDEAAAESAKATADAAKDTRAAMLLRFAYDEDLAVATYALIRQALKLVLGAGHASTEPQVALAKHRTALQPLAKSYGVKIVLVGDKSTAMLVLL